MISEKIYLYVGNNNLHQNKQISKKKTQLFQNFSVELGVKVFSN